MPGCCSLMSVKRSTRSFHRSCLTNWSTQVSKSPYVCGLILVFLQDRPQSVRIGKQTSKTITLKVWSVLPRGVCSPLCCSHCSQINDSSWSEPSAVVVRFLRWFHTGGSEPSLRSVGLPGWGWEVGWLVLWERFEVKRVRRQNKWALIFMRKTHTHEESILLYHSLSLAR